MKKIFFGHRMGGYKDLIKKYDPDFELHLMTIEEGDADVLKGMK